MKLVNRVCVSFVALVFAATACKTSNSDSSSIEPGRDMLKREGDPLKPILCSATPTDKHQKIFDANYTEDRAQKPGHISFRPVYKKYFMDAFATVPVGLLNHYFLHSSSYIQLTRGFDELYAKDPKSFVLELVIKDEAGRVAALLRGKRDNLGFSEIPTILINLSDDVIAAVDAGPLGEAMANKLKGQMSILPMAFAIYFAYAGTTLLPAQNASNPVNLERATYSDMAEAKRQLGFRMLAEMRHEAANNPTFFTDELKALIANDQMLAPIKADIPAWLDTPEAKAEYAKYLAAHNSGGLREFTNWTLANFMESSMCTQDFTNDNSRKYDPVKYVAADSFYKNEMKEQTFQGIIDAEKQYFGEDNKVASNGSTNGSTGLTEEEVNLSKEGPKFKAKSKLSAEAGMGLYLFPRLRNAVFYTLVAIRNVAAAVIYTAGNVALGAGMIVNRVVFGGRVWVNQQQYDGGYINYGSVNTNSPYVYGQPVRNVGRFAVRSLRAVVTGNPNQRIFGGCRFGRCN